MSVESKANEIPTADQLVGSELLVKTLYLLNRFSAVILASSEFTAQLSAIYMSVIPGEQKHITGDYGIPFKRHFSLYTVQHELDESSGDRRLAIERYDPGYGKPDSENERCVIGYRKFMKHRQEQFSPYLHYSYLTSESEDVFNNNRQAVIKIEDMLATFLRR